MGGDTTPKPDFEGFARAILEQWPTSDIDGADLFELSVSYGMISEVPGGYDPEHHIDAEGICPERGDPWYEYTFKGEAGPGLYSVITLKAERDEARRRRDEWRKKAEGYDAVRLALREKVGDPWPPHMSRVLWAGIAADQKKRAEAAEAERDALQAKLAVAVEALVCAKNRLLWAAGIIRNDTARDIAVGHAEEATSALATLAADTIPDPRIEGWNAAIEAAHAAVGGMPIPIGATKYAWRAQDAIRAMPCPYQPNEGKDDEAL